MSLSTILATVSEFFYLDMHDRVCGDYLRDLNDSGTNVPWIESDYSSDRVYVPHFDVSFYQPTSKKLTCGDVHYDMFHYPRWCNVLRKLDMLGYGNFYPVFKAVEQGLSESLSRLTDDNHVPTESEVLSALDNNLRSLTNYLTLKQHVRYVNLYPILAYNKVYYDMFRNSYYELDYNVRNYNLDFMQCDSVSTSIVDMSMLPVTFFDIYYHQWKKDLFTGILPDTQFGAVSMLPSTGNVSLSGIAFNGTTSTDIGRWKSGKDKDFGAGFPVYYSTVDNGELRISGSEGNTWLQHNHSITGTATLSSSSITTSFDVLALKRAEALQGYRQALLRAGNKTDDVFKAVFGRAPRYEADSHPYFIDAFGEDIFVDAVVSTAETNSDSDTTAGKLGDLGGRAVLNGKSRSIKFDSSDFGIILVVQYIIPQAEYNSYMLDPHLANLTPEDHWIPAFENLGFSPVLGEYLNNLQNRNLNRVLGYVPRYFEFKCDVDKVHGSFIDVSSARSLGDTIVPFSGFLGELTHWVTPRTELQSTDTTLVRNFYVDPSVLDNVFLSASDGSYSTDQFICNTYLDVKAVRPLSVLGLPNF